MESSKQATAQTAAPIVLDPAHGVILFDGVCNFCNGSVNFIIDNDPHDYFRFAALQSDVGQALLERFYLPRSDFDSIVLIEGGRIYVKSTAALRIARRLKFPLSLGGLLLLVPRLIRDIGYTIIAKNRYQWFGKQDQCRLPTPAIRARFL